MTVDDAFTKVLQEKIRRWVVQEDLAVRDHDTNNPDIVWALLVTDGNERRTLISQHQRHQDRVLLEATVTPSEAQLAKLHKLSDHDRDAFLWDLKLDLVRIGADFHGVVPGLEGVHLLEFIFFEGGLDSVFAKDTFMQRLAHVRRAVAATQWLIQRRLGPD